MLPKSRKDREYQKFVEDDEGNTAVRAVIVNQEEGGGFLANSSYVASSAVVTGTRDGSFDRPFDAVQNGIDRFGVPTTQAEYLTPKIVNILDTSTYTEGGTLTIPTGIWTINFPEAVLNCNIVWELDNAERFGSTQQPRLTLSGNVDNVTTRVTGTITVVRKAGGSIISLGTIALAGFNISGTVTIADGTNGGDAVFTQAVLSHRSVGYSGSIQILGRNTFVSFTDSAYNPATAMEVGAISFIRNSTINSLDISEYLNTTTTRTVRGLQLNNSGGVTYRAIGSVRNWNVDAISGSEVLTKITSFPNNALNLIKPVAGAIGIQDVGNYFTATDVEGALQEIGAKVESGTYTPTLTGVTNVTSTTARKCQYLRVGNTVTVSGQCDITPTLIGLAVIGISLPMASNFGTAFECGGAGHTPAVAGQGAAIYADITNNRAELSYIDSLGVLGVMTFTFTYEII